MIKIENLYKKFGDNEVLRGVNLEIRDGETVVIIGKSGCGKSVLLKHIMGLLRPDKGKIIVDGIDISSSKDTLFEIRKKFGLVFQGAALFDSLTVAENVMIGLIEKKRMKFEEMLKMAREKLELVGLKDVEFLKPSELSGGMKKRVGIARALALDPEYILYDEPTTGLDPIIAEKINLLIIDLKKRLNKTTIVVTHDMHSAFKVGDRIAMLNEGRIIFDGKPEELLRSKVEEVKEFINSSSIVS